MQEQDLKILGEGPIDVNKIGLSIKDYICPLCGHIHSSLFLLNRKPVQCYKCKVYFEERGVDSVRAALE